MEANKRKWLYTKKFKSRLYLAESIPDAVNVNDIELFVNTTTQAKFLLQCLEQTAIGIGLHVNTFCCLLQAL